MSAQPCTGSPRAGDYGEPEPSRVERLLCRLEGLSGQLGDESRWVADRLVEALVQHFVDEEEFVFPAVRASVPAGPDLVELELDEHDHIESLLVLWQSQAPGDPGFWPAAHCVIKQVREHLRDEADLLRLVDLWSPRPPGQRSTSSMPSPSRRAG